jgi:hypothetical protein
MTRGQAGVGLGREAIPVGHAIAGSQITYSPRAVGDKSSRRACNMPQDPLILLATGGRQWGWQVTRRRDSRYFCVGGRWVCYNREGDGV